MSDALVFIYNAAGGRLSAALDIAHKAISPGTYNCDLCKLTHGLLKERRAWTAFREQFALQMEFFHKDKWSEGGGTEYTYPVILRRRGEHCEVFMTADEIALQSNVAMLISTIEKRL